MPYRNTDIPRPARRGPFIAFETLHDPDSVDEGSNGDEGKEREVISESSSPHRIVTWAGSRRNSVGHVCAISESTSRRHNVT